MTWSSAVADAVAEPAAAERRSARVSRPRVRSSEADRNALFQAGSGRSPLRHQNGTDAFAHAAERPPRSLRRSPDSGGEEICEALHCSQLAVCASSRSSPRAQAARSSATHAQGRRQHVRVAPRADLGRSPTRRPPASTSTTTRSARAAASRRSQNRQVDFGASDAPLTPDQFNACNGCVQIPWTASGTSVAYNLPGAPPHLKITGRCSRTSTSARSRSGTTPRSRSSTRASNLPDTDITPIFRSDGSGTTYNFTDYLSKVSGEFKSKVGVGTQVNFPAASAAAARRASPPCSRARTAGSRTSTSPSP